MKYEVIDMKIAHSVQATLTIYAHEDYPEVYGERKRPMIVICPGGGYEHVSPREGEAIALQFMTTGAHAAVLRYDVSGQGAEFPQHLLELAASVAYVRKHAAEYCIDPDKILVAGFSAGGHLAASLGCFWKEKWLEELMQAETGATMKDYQPNGEILAYPVITSGKFAHRGSFVKIMGSEAEQGMQDSLPQNWKRSLAWRIRLRPISRRPLCGIPLKMEPFLWKIHSFSQKHCVRPG